MEGGGLMAAVLPTKGNLMAAKRSRTLAQTGYELMDRKRNILVREMMELMDSASQLQSRSLQRNRLRSFVKRLRQIIRLRVTFAVILHLTSSA